MLIRFVPTSVCLTLLAGCCMTRTVANETAGRTLDISVFYRERIMLPAGSQLEVT